MNTLRISLWAPDYTAVTAVVREEGLTCSLDELIEKEMAVPGVFVTFKKLDLPELDEPELTLRVMQSMDAERESNMAILYYYDAEMLSMMSSSGVLSTKDPSPLSVEQIEFTLKQLGSHPVYLPTQRVLVQAEDGTVVELAEGDVKVLAA